MYLDFPSDKLELFSKIGVKGSTNSFFFFEKYSAEIKCPLLTTRSELRFSQFSPVLKRKNGNKNGISFRTLSHSREREEFVLSRGKPPTTFSLQGHFGPPIYKTNFTRALLAIEICIKYIFKITFIQL